MFGLRVKGDFNAGYVEFVECSVKISFVVSASICLNLTSYLLMKSGVNELSQAFEICLLNFCLPRIDLSHYVSNALVCESQ